MIDNGLLFRRGHLVGVDVGCRFGGCVTDDGRLCTACAGGQAVGALVPPRAGGTLSVEFFLAFVEFYKLRFCLPPCLVGGGFVFPSPHISIVKHFSGVHVFDVCFHLVLVSGEYIDGCAYFLFSIELAGVGGRRR